MLSGALWSSTGDKSLIASLSISGLATRRCIDCMSRLVNVNSSRKAIRASSVFISVQASKGTAACCCCWTSVMDSMRDDREPTLWTMVDVDSSMRKDRDAASMAATVACSVSNLPSISAVSALMALSDWPFFASSAASPLASSLTDVKADACAVDMSLELQGLQRQQEDRVHIGDSLLHLGPLGAAEAILELSVPVPAPVAKPGVGHLAAGIPDDEVLQRLQVRLARLGTVGNVQEQQRGRRARRVCSRRRGGRDAYALDAPGEEVEGAGERLGPPPE
ncbi:uncharacterized protein B0I36DRAFT_432574 [Microdochium trichocladiopsis]|uniref:Uncharacterized protein n=1 Tax=Microdochium trichocladiopsis TaxID=1682393 RepID=A0A9P8Y1P5_9PEZI|nr:uncharacterized protein B0I36DRAFT_432574 [Microdochium trichocladiopsis]KAH7027259.1 hypothetical protein B0I36DRAFT_432574 [Microdochium trichocladiopsis]